jgi:hypothetical protein
MMYTELPTTFLIWYAPTKVEMMKCKLAKIPYVIFQQYLEVIRYMEKSIYGLKCIRVYYVLCINMVENKNFRTAVSEFLPHRI